MDKQGELLEDVEPEWAMNESISMLDESYKYFKGMHGQTNAINWGIIDELTGIIESATSLKYLYEKKRKTAPITKDRWDSINDMLGYLCKTVECFKYPAPKMELYETKGNGYVLLIDNCSDLDVVEIEDPHNDDEIMDKAFDLLKQYKAITYSNELPV